MPSLLLVFWLMRCEYHCALEANRARPIGWAYFHSDPQTLFSFEVAILQEDLNAAKSSNSFFFLVWSADFLFFFFSMQQ